MSKWIENWHFIKKEIIFSPHYISQSPRRGELKLSYTNVSEKKGRRILYFIKSLIWEFLSLLVFRFLRFKLKSGILKYLTREMKYFQNRIITSYDSDWKIIRTNEEYLLIFVQENSSTRYNIFIYKYKFRHFLFLAPLLQHENSRQISIILCVIFHGLVWWKVGRAYECVWPKVVNACERGGVHEGRSTSIPVTIT